MSWTADREAFREAYYEKLKSPKWQKVRLQVMERAKFKCECCGDGDEQLQIHHLIYIKGREPWDYPLNHFECLCATCHEWREQFNSYYPRGLTLTWACHFLSGFIRKQLKGELQPGQFARVFRAMKDKTPSIPEPEYYI